MPSKTPDVPREDLAKLARSSDAFGFDLYQRVRGTPGNLVISPASITTALTMTWAGARGETAEQMRFVLHLEGTPEEVMTSSGQLSRSLQDPARPITFRIANRLFAQKSYPLLPDYQERVLETFGAPVEPLDFVDAPEPSRLHINQWVESQTEKRIKDLIPDGGINSLTRLVLVNAIYFLGSWLERFRTEMTHPEPFHLSPSKMKEVPTMHRTGDYRVVSRYGLTALELPYEGGDLSMLLLVPDRIDGLAAVEASLDAHKLDSLAGALRSEKVQLSLPKFEVNPSASLSLGDELQAMGMPLAFDASQADFGGITDSPEGCFLSEVVHKGFVKVDEKGTEAAAATAVMMRSLGFAREDPPRRVQVDRPFLFLIRDDASGMVLFLGRVSDPQQPG
jgi:serpin B